MLVNSPVIQASAPSEQQTGFPAYCDLDTLLPFLLRTLMPINMMNLVSHWDGVDVLQPSQANP